MKWFKRLLYTMLICVVLGGATVGGLYLYVKPELPSVETLRDVRWQTPMQVFTADGHLVSQFGEKRRIPIKLEDVPQPLIDAFLATEDSRFYEHFGVDPIGVMRAFSVLITTGEVQQGASTITMQLARNFFLTFERALMRKIKESFIAVHIEQQLSKDEILELYLNKITFGHRAHGIGAAAQVYYGKELHELTLAQMATLAGLPKAPSNLNPISNPQASKERRRVVLLRMLDENKITRTQFDEAANAPVTARRHGAEVTVSAPYLAEMVRQEMVDRFGEEEAYTGGYNVYTTVKSDVQLAARQAVWDNLHSYDERHGYRGPISILWSEEEGQEALPQEEIEQYLEQLKRIGDVTPAVVTGVEEQTATVMVKGAGAVTLPWESMHWAREYLNEERQGEPPETASDIMQPGHVIWLRTVNEQWRLAQIPEPSSAIASLRPDDGAAAAVVGGYSFTLSQYNRALQAERQVGSNIKPLIYSAAFEEGLTLATLVNDAPINQWNPGSGIAWRPKNSPEVYEGPIRLRKGLAKSKNVVSVRLIREVGVEKVADHIAKFGLKRDTIPENESLSLGSLSMTPMEVARAYAVFANGGFLVEPYFIDRIEDMDGNTVYKADPVRACYDCEKPAPQVISEQNAFLVEQAMNSAVWGGGSWPNGTGWNGTSWRIQRSKPITQEVGRNIAGKTGTTNDVRDTWFSGFTSGLVTTTWVGFDDVSRKLGRTSKHPEVDSSQQAITGGEAGAKTALPGWILFMEKAIPEYPAREFSIPPGVVNVRIDLETGKLSRKNDYTSRFEYFIRGTEPTEYVRGDSNNDDIFEDEGGLF
ncbi:penicillin-sensitive transpeptidase [Idiomarina sp. WRN-38]|uniref:penicillin-binding protein 1A n=1 Tax=Idiomarina sp. OXR-189 TaxID=3100175 RepID=UPI0007336200|nr:penicillin-binding protein 1A [Idiomarina sp. OXR-189]KTG24615.1 penicillin-sensitive transpeptidase [Idiomarina sp. H105]OAE93121.1 penicillin-sensitive transpeptidase [Idiomarina sp. WRN-38]WPZ01222.1 penicillin-binding protein 1A [Idiomarina sp. OXR-189]